MLLPFTVIIQYWLYSLCCIIYTLAHLQFSHSVMSNSLQHHGLQHARPPYPSPTPGVCSNSCALSRWCHPTISSSVIPFSSYLQSFPESGSFQMSQFFPSGAQSIGVSASASVLPMNIQDWFQIGKGTCQGCILSPCLFNLYAEYIMRNAEQNESQAGNKIAWGKYQ